MVIKFQFVEQNSVECWCDFGVKDLLKTSQQIGLSLSNCAALEIVDDQYRLITSDASNYNIQAYGLKSYWENGEYLQEKIDDSLKFKPLRELLSKNIISGVN